MMKNVRLCALAFCLLSAGMFSLPMDWSASAEPQEGLSKVIWLKAKTIDPMMGTSDKIETIPDGEGMVAGLLQLEAPMSGTQMDLLDQLGVRIYDYIPEDTYLVRVPLDKWNVVEGLPLTRWLGAYLPEYKTVMQLEGTGASLGVENTLVTIHLFEASESATRNIAGIADLKYSQRNQVYAFVDSSSLDLILALPDVKWVEPIRLLRPTNDVAVTITNVDDVWTTPYQLTGQGQLIAQADTGLDDGNVPTNHPDFGNRVEDILSWKVQPYSCVVNVGMDDGGADEGSGHGTHVAGTAVGDGTKSFQWGEDVRGIAYDSTLLFQAIEQWTVYDQAEPGCPANNGWANSGLPFDKGLLFQQAYDGGALIHMNEYHDPAITATGDYTDDAMEADDFVNTHREFVMIFAAGNGGVDDPGGTSSDGETDPDSVSPPGTAKNGITVGASETLRNTFGRPYGVKDCDPGPPFVPCFPVNPIWIDTMDDHSEGMAAFSGRGWTTDGRIKPDIVAPGTYILSTRSTANPPAEIGWGLASDGGYPAGMDNWYMFNGGTSMAIPHVAGATALVREWYADHGYSAPSAALVKATLINGAVDMAGQYTTGGDGDGNGAAEHIPNEHEGWGRLDMIGTVGDQRERLYWDELIALTQASTDSHYVWLSDSTEPLRASLVWTDPPGSVAATVALQNNLNLRVRHVATDTCYYGNAFFDGRTGRSTGWAIAVSPCSGPVASSILQDFDPSMDGLDERNNVENVYIQFPQVGLYEILVSAQGITAPHLSQDFALLVSGAEFDDTTPISSVDPLPTYEPLPSFTVSWTGTDPGVAPSGIAYYDIQYKDKDGTNIWIDWLPGTTANQATFNAAEEHMYCFQSRATDRAGNVEDYPGGDGDTCTTVVLDTTPPTSSVDPLPTYEAMSFTVSWTGTDPGVAPSGIAYYDIQYKDKDGTNIWIDWLPGTTANQATFNAAEEHMYCFQSRATDRAGNVEDYPGGDGDTCTTVDATPPVEPTGLTVTNPMTGNRLDLDWDDNPEPDLDHYDVEWKLQPDPWPGNRISPVYASQYTHLGLIDGTTYCYRIIAVDIPGLESPPGPSAGVCETPTDEIPPNIITDLAATAGPNIGQISLTWTAPGDSGTDGTASQYDMRWSDAGSINSWATWNAANQIADEPIPSPYGSAESYIFECPACDATYWFNIRAGDEVPNWANPDFSNSPSAFNPYGETTTFWFEGVEYSDSEYNIQFGDNGGSKTIYVEVQGDTQVSIAQLDLTGQQASLTYTNSFDFSIDADPGTDYHVQVYNGAAELEHIPEDALEAEQTETDYAWDLESHYKIAQSFQFSHSKLTDVELYLDLCRLGGDVCEGSLTVTVHIQEQLDCEPEEPCFLGTDSQSIPTPFTGWRTFTFDIDGLSSGTYYIVVNGYCGPDGCFDIQICFWCDVKGGTGNPYSDGMAYLYPPGQGWNPDPDKDLAFKIYYEGFGGYYTEGHFEKTITRTTHIEVAFLYMDQSSPPGTQIETFYWDYTSSRWVSLGTGDQTYPTLPTDPGGQNVRVRYEFSGTESSTPKMWEYSIYTNHLPTNAAIDIGNWVGNWDMSGTFDYTVTIDDTTTTPDFEWSLTDYLNGKSGLVMVPITIHSDTAGTIRVSNLYIRFCPT